MEQLVFIRCTTNIEDSSDFAAQGMTNGDGTPTAAALQQAYPSIPYPGIGRLIPICIIHGFYFHSSTIVRWISLIDFKFN